MKSNHFTGVILLSVSSFLFLLTGYISSIWLARFLGPSDFGVYGIIISIITAVNIFQTAGLPQAVSKYISQNPDKSDSILKKALNLQIVYSIILTGIIFLLSKPIAFLLKDTSLVVYIQLASISFLFYGITSLYLGYYNGFQNFTRQAFINITQSVVRLMAIIVLSYSFSISGAIWGVIIASVAASVVAFHLPKNHSTRFLNKRLILFSIPIIGFTFLITILQSADIFFVKALINADENTGFYNASQSIARVPFFALSVFSSILFPTISKHVGDQNMERIRYILHKTLRIILILLIPGTLLISATSAVLIHLLYSTVYLPAAPSLSILIFASGFLTVFTVLANILNGAGEPNKSLIISLVGVILTAFSCLFMVPKYGLVGAALSTTIGSFIAMVLATYFVYKRFKALVPIKSCLKIIIASLIISFLAYYIPIPTILLPVLYIILFTLYFLILIFLKEITKQDWDLVKGLLPSWTPLIK